MRESSVKLSGSKLNLENSEKNRKGFCSMAEATTLAESQMTQVRIGKVHELSKDGSLAWVRIPSEGGSFRTVVIFRYTGKKTFTCHYGNGSAAVGIFGEESTTVLPEEKDDVALEIDPITNPSLVLKWATFPGYPRTAKTPPPTVPVSNHIPGMVRPGPHRSRPRSQSPFRR